MPRSILALALAGLLASTSSTSILAQEVPARLDTKAGPVAIETFAEGLAHPWGAAFLPDGQMLVTERPGRLRVVSREGEVSDPIQGVPEVYAQGQGGLLDVALDPDFDENRRIWLTFAEAREGGAATSAGRGRLNEDATAIEDFEVIFRQEPALPGGRHFGSRVVFADDKVFISTGDRGHDDQAQDPNNHVGALVRLNRDGSVPDDNPFVGRDDARPEIWSYGHRNIQGADRHPETGEIWTVEMGPRGGDEVNVPQRGENHGWPVVSFGTEYDGRDIPDPPTRQEFVQPIKHWTPAISPSGVTFYTGEAFPEWRGDLFLGALSGQTLVRVAFEGKEAVDEERLDVGVRIRQVRQGPEGHLYLLVDRENGSILRLSPAD